MQEAGSSTTVLDGKIYTIGGNELASVDIYDTSTSNWATGVPLSTSVKNSTAVSVNGKIYLVAGLNSSDQNLNQVLCLILFQIIGLTKQICHIQFEGTKLVWFENRIWAIGGYSIWSYDKIRVII